MTTPQRGLLFHFTHIENLGSVVTSGLCCDNVMASPAQQFVNVGNQEIKARRRARSVPLPPGGVVADYVPFYFAARSPMLYAIHMNNVSTYVGGQDEVVYLVTSTAAVTELRLPFVFTDRNASLALARYSNDLTEIGSLVDWPLMENMMFRNTDRDPDRVERRMAEFLVQQHLPFEAVLGVAARTDARAEQVSQLLTSLGFEATPVATRASWYF